MKNSVLEFIKAHPEGWRQVLTAEPYCLRIKDLDELCIFNYDQIHSDFSLPEVCQARGLIINLHTLKIVRWAFDKFFNFQESHAAKIDWATARIQEKVDGSILSLSYWDRGNDEEGNSRSRWIWSTNGTIDAFNTPLPSDLGEQKTFGEMANDLFIKQGGRGLFTVLNPAMTYTFELTSPENRVVVPYTDRKLTFLGMRDNETGEEVADDFFGFPRPKTYDFESFEAMVASTDAMPFSEEGYVVVDANWNRVKVKGKQYLVVHRLRSSDGTLTMDKAVELFRSGEHEEFLSYFPEYQHIFDKVKLAWETWCLKLADAVEHALRCRMEGMDKKTFATVEVKKHPADLSKFMFAVFDKKNMDKLLAKITWEDLNRA